MILLRRLTSVDRAALLGDDRSFVVMDRSRDFIARKNIVMPWSPLTFWCTVLDTEAIVLSFWEIK